MLRGRPRPLHSPLLDSPIYIFELRLLWWFPDVINSRFLRIKHFPASYEMYCCIFIMLIPNLLFCVSPMSHPVLSHQPPILVNYLASFFQRAIPGCALALLDTSLTRKIIIWPFHHPCTSCAKTALFPASPLLIHGGHVRTKAHLAGYRPSSSP